MSYKKVSDWAQMAFPALAQLVSVPAACRTLLRFDRWGKFNSKVTYSEWLWFHAPLNGGGVA